MMKIFAAWAIGLVSIVPAAAQSNNPLAGVWRQDDGAATVRIASCEKGPYYCAIVVAEKLELGEASRLGKITVKDIRPSGQRRWTGVFVDQGATMNAKVQQISADVISFKICAIPFLCETKRFQRIQR